MKKHPIKVVYVIGQLGYGGAERQLLELASGLNPADYLVTVICLSNDVAMSAEYAERGVKVIDISRIIPGDPTRLLRLWLILRRIQPDVVHGYLSTGILWGSLAAWMAGVERVVGGWRLADPADSWNLRVVNRLIGPRLDLIISNTTAMAEILIERDDIPRHKIIVIPNGVDTDRFSVLPSKVDARHQLGLNDDLPVVGMIARFFPQKDHASFLDAMAQVIQDYGPVHLVLVGDGPLKAAVVEQSERLGIARYCHFLGTRDDIPLIMSALDVLALSSRWEGMPNVLAEGMASGLPIVATSVGGVSEIIISGESGLLVDPGDVKSFALATRALLEDDVVSRALRTAGKSRIQNEFSVKRMVEKTAIAYADMFM